MPERDIASRMAAARRSRSSPITHFATTSTPRLFNSAVRCSEFVSRRSGVSISEPTAMISASIRPAACP